MAASSSTVVVVAELEDWEAKAECRTPMKSDCRVPAPPTTCPPAPKKQRPTALPALAVARQLFTAREMVD